MAARKQEQAVYLHLGIHNSIDQRIPDRGFTNSLQLAEHQLQRTKGQVVYLMEDIRTPLPLAEMIGEMSRQGTRPALAYVGSIMMEERGDVLEGEVADAFLRDYFQDHTYHDEVVRLDELWQQYPGRVRVALEGIPEEELTRRFTTIGERTADIDFDRALQFAKQGQFDEAVVSFQRSARDTAEFAKRREELLEGRIDQILSDRKVSAVVVRFGSAHSVLERSLTRRGHTVHTEYDIDDNGEVFEDTPYGRMVELSRSPRGERITQLQWYQAVIAEMMENVLSRAMYEANGQIDYNMISRVTRSAVEENITSIEQIRTLEGKIRQAIATGGSFVDVLEGLGS